MKEYIRELRELRDEAKCTDDNCVCEKYDRIIDYMESLQSSMNGVLKVIADPKHSDGEGLAEIPQVVPDGYISDGECLDMFIVALEEHSMSIDKVATELAKEEEE
jgi:hypothetical protein